MAVVRIVTGCALSLWFLWNINLSKTPLFTPEQMSNFRIQTNHSIDLVRKGWINVDDDDDDPFSTTFYVPILGTFNTSVTRQTVDSLEVKNMTVSVLQDPFRIVIEHIHIDAVVFLNISSRVYNTQAHMPICIEDGAFHIVFYPWKLTVVPKMVIDTLHLDIHGHNRIETMIIKLFVRRSLDMIKTHIAEHIARRTLRKLFH